MKCVLVCLLGNYFSAKNGIGQDIGSFYHYVNVSVLIEFLQKTSVFTLSRPAISPDLGRRLSAFSLHCRLTGFEVHFTGEIENLLAFFFR